MHKTIIIGTILLLSSMNLSAQEDSISYYTWNIDSTSVYQSPDALSTELVKVPYGTKVNILDSLKMTKARIVLGQLVSTIGNFSQGGQYVLRTSWLKIQYGETVGYSLKAEIIDFNPMLLKNGLYEFSNIEAPQEDTEYVLSDGSKLAYSKIDGCTYRKLVLNDKTMAQAYMILRVWHYDANIKEELSFNGFGESIITFSAPQSSIFKAPYLSMPIEERIEIGSYSCN